VYRLATLLLSGTALIGASGGSVGLAAEDEAVSREVAIANDIALIAAKNNWSIEETEFHEYASDVLIETVERVSAARPDVFVGSAVGKTPYAPPTIFISGTADDEIRGLIASAAVTIDIADGQPYSQVELTERRRAVHYALLEAGYTHVMTRTDIREMGALKVVIGAEPELPRLEAVIRDLIPPRLRDEVEISFVDSPIPVYDSAAYGGMWTTRNGNNYCTAGWAVEHTVTHETGVTTANHCADPGQTDGFKHPGIGIHSATKEDGYYGPWGDVAWFSTGQTEPAKFYADIGDVRNVEAVATSNEYPLDHEICVFGRQWHVEHDEGRHCANLVDATAMCGIHDYGVIMTPRVTTQGDSGAGWSRFHKAFGSHVGGCTWQDSLFAPTHGFDNAMNVVVRTQ
jgi:hypothetical protein